MPLRLIVTYGNYGKSPLTEQEKDLPMGGCKSALLALSTELARRGHNVHVFAEGAEAGGAPESRTRSLGLRHARPSWGLIVYGSSKRMKDLVFSRA